MTTRHAARTTLGEELRKKFKSPRDALRALGIDASVLKDPRLAFDGAKKMASKTVRPTRLEYLAVMGAARAINPLLALDKKVELGPIFKGLTTKNLKARKATIVGDVKKALKGKTIAKDASIEHLASMLDHFEHTNEPKTMDVSVSPAQHNAMEAAAHGHSNLGIPQNVGKEFEHADKGHVFRDALPDFLKGKGMDEESIKHVMDGLASDDEMPDNALDEEEEGVNIEVEEAEDKIEEEEGEDAAADEIEEEEAEDGDIEEEEAEDHGSAKDRKGGKDAKHAKDQAMKATKSITQDQLDAAIKAAVSTERKNTQKAMEAREFVRPFVGELPMALDSAEKIHRAAAVALGIEGAEEIHASALPTLIKMQPRHGTRTMAEDSGDTVDQASAKSFNDRFPGAARIGIA